ncbi:MAG TPA: ABC transporter ATP-binding protein [Firmicutes bacterium]|nr:ABC transporter ATP-binding protein [Bacillota bacterium]
MQLTQINSDIKNALSIYSVQDNRDMVKIKDGEHYIVNEVPVWRRVYRKIRRSLTIRKPMVKALRDKGVIRDRSVNLAKFKTHRQWSMIRGSHIATIFQDPMTSLNPLLKIGSQITDVLRLHHNLTKSEAKKEAISLLEKVHIPNPEERFNDYPYQYSGGMRQRVVIAIALACRPDILICDEPTTALDVTVQSQILALIKELQQEYKFTTIFITHDLGVVAGVADRVGVMYGGQLVEIGTDEDVFYRPAHPYTWALLSSLPQLAVENEPLTFIRGNPPVFTKEIEGDSFAPRSDYAMRIDYMIEPPMFKISDTHYAKTWLLDPRAPKVKKPLLIRNLSKRMEETAKSFLSTDASINGGE